MATFQQAFSKGDDHAHHDVSVDHETAIVLASWRQVSDQLAEVLDQVLAKLTEESAKHFAQRRSVVAITEQQLGEVPLVKEKPQHRLIVVLNGRRVRLGRLVGLATVIGDELPDFRRDLLGGRAFALVDVLEIQVEARLGDSRSVSNASGRQGISPLVADDIDSSLDESALGLSANAPRAPRASRPGG